MHPHGAKSKFQRFILRFGCIHMLMWLILKGKGKAVGVHIGPLVPFIVSNPHNRSSSFLRGPFDIMSNICIPICFVFVVNVIFHNIQLYDWHFIDIFWLFIGLVWY